MPSKKEKKVKAWFVTCSKGHNMTAFTKKQKAKAHAGFLDREYSGYCDHKTYPCIITYKI